MPKVRIVHYRCSEEDCEAEDSDKLFEHENPVVVWVCWKCHKHTMNLITPEPNRRAA